MTLNISKNITNLEIADLLKNISAAYSVKDPDKYRFHIIAYERASDVVEHLTIEMKDIFYEGKLEDIPGIGKNIALHLSDIFKKGRSVHFEKILNGLPEGMFELIKIQGIGPKTAHKLATELKINGKNPIKKLKKHLKRKDISKLEGFGKDSENKLLSSIRDFEKQTIRLLLPYAENIANDVIDWMMKCDKTERVDVLGSLRRKTSTVGDVDISVSTDNPRAVIEHFCNYPKAKKILEKGEKTASIILPGAAKQIDLMVQKKDAYGALLQHFTGSKSHNISLREYANIQKHSLSEYGIKENGKDKITKEFKDEESLYKYLGLSWIPPELRENRGEIDAALNNKLPELVDLSFIKSDLQIHSDYDTKTSHDLGISEWKDIVKKANDLNYEYIALTDHNPGSGGNSDKKIIEILKKRKEFIGNINYTIKNENKYRLKYVFNSLEIDIKKDGSLPVPEKGLEILDFALVSIHSSFRLKRQEMTKRILKSLEFPKVKIIAHPTGRRINKRLGIEADWQEIFKVCRRKNIWVEINADPVRLDLPDTLVKEAVKSKVLMTLGTDSHHKDSMDNMGYGVYVARRGWAENDNIVNTRGFEEFKKML